MQKRKNEPVPPMWGAGKGGVPTNSPDDILNGGGLYPLGGDEINGETNDGSICAEARNPHGASKLERASVVYNSTHAHPTSQSQATPSRQLDSWLG